MMIRSVVVVVVSVVVACLDHKGGVSPANVTGEQLIVSRFVPGT